MFKEAGDVFKKSEEIIIVYFTAPLEVTTQRLPLDG